MKSIVKMLLPILPNICTTFSKTYRTVWQQL